MSLEDCRELDLRLKVEMPLFLAALTLVTGLIRELYLPRVPELPGQ